MSAGPAIGGQPVHPTAVRDGFEAQLRGHLGSGLQTTSQQRGSLYRNDPNLPILVNACLELLPLLSHAKQSTVKERHSMNA